MGAKPPDSFSDVKFKNRNVNYYARTKRSQTLYVEDSV